MAVEDTFGGVRRLLLWSIGLVVLALVLLGGLGVVRYQADEQEREDRRESVCAAQRDLSEATLEAFVLVFTPQDATPEEIAEIEAGEALYHKTIEPVLARCGTLR